MTSKKGIAEETHKNEKAFESEDIKVIINLI